MYYYIHTQCISYLKRLLRTSMSITFENEADILWRVFKILLHTFYKKQYLFAAQCVWWLSVLDGLHPVLVYYIDNERFPSGINNHEAINQPNREDRVIVMITSEIQL